MFIVLCLVTVLIICCAAYKLSHRKMERSFDKLPGDKVYPIIGNMWSYAKAKNTNEIMKQAIADGKRYLEYGLFKGCLGHNYFVFVTDPKYIEAIANSPHATEKSPFISVLLQGLPQGVFTINDKSTWRALRKPLAKILTKKHLENEYHGVFLSKNEKFVRYMKNKKCGEEINVFGEMLNLFVDIVSETLLGVETNEVEEGKFNVLAHIHQFIGCSFKPALLCSVKVMEFIRPMIMSKRLKTSVIETRRFLSWALQKRITEKTKEGDRIYYTDFLLERKMELNLPMKQIEMELVDVVFAGSETPAVTASTALLFLAMFPEIQEAAYQEQVSIFGEDLMRDPTPEDLANMVYLTQIIKETLRFCGPGFILKQASGDVELDHYTIPKGTIIVIEIDAASFDERYWEKAREFYPDHFLPEKEAERPAYAFPIFGFGPRNCPGSHFAMNSLKGFLSSILRTFRLSTSTRFEDLQVTYSLMREFSSYMVKFEERNNCKTKVLN